MNMLLIRPLLIRPLLICASMILAAAVEAAPADVETFFGEYEGQAITDQGVKRAVVEVSDPLLSRGGSCGVRSH